jgi:hypothetical protein
LHLDDEGRFHGGKGPAMVWPDGYGVYAWHGVQVPARLVTHPETLEARKIAGESNVEIRRVMIERYGEARFLHDVGAQVVNFDECGRLWRLEPTRSEQEPLCLVEVEDATPGPGQVRKRYFLRVPPEARTARQAVAWTFGMSADAYVPTVET